MLLFTFSLAISIPVINKPASWFNPLDVSSKEFIVFILKTRLITPPPGLIILPVSSACGYNNAPRWESLSFLFTAAWWPWLASTLPYFHSIHPSLQKCWHCNNPAFQRPPRAACLLTSRAPKQAHPWHFPQRHLVKSINPEYLWLGRPPLVMRAVEGLRGNTVTCWPEENIRHSQFF